MPSTPDDDKEVGPGAPEDDVLAPERAAFDTERDGFDLFRAACLMPRVVGRDGDVRACVERVEQLGHALRKTLPRGDDARVAALVRFLFTEQGFAGDADSYDAPENSFLCDVLARRRGLPITLSLVTMAVADAAGMRTFGVALPRHFVVGVASGDGFALVDPFHGGRILGADDVKDLTGVAGLDVVGHAVAQTTPRAVLMRMLANLHGSFLRRGEREPLVGVLSRMLIFEPRHPALLVQRAQVRVELGEVGEALADLDAALKLSPDDDVRRAAEELHKRLTADARWVH